MCAYRDAAGAIWGTGYRHGRGPVFVPIEMLSVRYGVQDIDMEGGPVFVPIEMLLVRSGVQDIGMEGGPVCVPIEMIPMR